MGHVHQRHSPLDGLRWALRSFHCMDVRCGSVPYHTDEALQTLQAGAQAMHSSFEGCQGELNMYTAL